MLTTTDVHVAAPSVHGVDPSGGEHSLELTRDDPSDWLQAAPTEELQATLEAIARSRAGEGQQLALEAEGPSISDVPCPKFAPANRQPEACPDSMQQYTTTPRFDSFTDKPLQ